MTERDHGHPLGPVAVSVAGLSKRFPGVQALDDVSFECRRGEITAVVGENGAGKSTLMGILTGQQRPDTGTVHVSGVPVSVFTPHALLSQHRVALVPQEIAVCLERSVAQNILLGAEGRRLPSSSMMRRRTRQLLASMETELDPDRLAGSLSVADQQLVLIARAVARDCRVLILDEPTTSLTPHEVEHLFNLLRRLRDGGTTVLYVSHRLPEIMALSDRVLVLRDGQLVAESGTASITVDAIVRSMVGRVLDQRPVHQRGIGDVRLSATGLSGSTFTDVDLHVGAGEVLGVAGLPDSGRSEVVAALFGAVPSTGSVHLDGAPVRLRSPRHAIAEGIGYVPAERRAEAIFPDLTIGINSALLDLDNAKRWGVIRRSRIDRLASSRLAEFDVRGNHHGPITGLSGGNQQKVVLSRWLARRPRVLLLDDPTRGVDVGAKSEIYARIEQAARQRSAIVMASSDLPELLRVCDRIAVMAGGRLAGTVEAASTTEADVMSLATGAGTVATTMGVR